MLRWRKSLVAAWVACAALVCMVSATRAAVKLPAIFSDNMILQRDQAVPVWGWAKPDEEITVDLSGPDRRFEAIATDPQSRAAAGTNIIGFKAKAKAGPDGRWRATLALDKWRGRLEGSGPYELTVKGSDGGPVTLKNVLVGEVWLCSGQSNMEMSVGGSLNAKEEIAAAAFPKIRLFTVQKKTATQPQTDCVGKWSECSPKTVAGFSAVGYFFIRKLHQDLGVPVGMIHTSWGGTPAEAWISRKALDAEPSLKPLLERWDSGKGGPKNSPHWPASLYNGMIAPVVPMAIRGSLWYQGESNVGRDQQYRTLMPLLIRDWRTAWGEGDFPFGLVQLAPYTYDRRPGSVGTACAALRDAQTATLAASPNTGMAVTMDVGAPKDIHPKNKQAVGNRLALWALAKVYGKDVVCCGPMYKGMSVEGDKVRITLDHADGGLATRDGKEPSDFTIAGEDKKFVPAKAVIDGQSIVVSAAGVAKPVAVRYAWRDDAEPNLMNKSGLPACPFRTDR